MATGDPSNNAGQPSREEVRGTLGRLCTHGLAQWWVRQNGHTLFRLECVRERAARDHDGDPVPATIEIVRELILEPEFKKTAYGVILYYVLGVDESFLEFNAQERRTFAGEEFRGGSNKVTWGTIRQYHEPKALDHLAAFLMRLENSTRAEPQN